METREGPEHAELRDEDMDLLVALLSTYYALDTSQPLSLYILTVTTQRRRHDRHMIDENKDVEGPWGMFLIP